MHARPSTAADTEGLSSRRLFIRKLFRYAAGSVIATICSETMFVLVYGPFHGSAAAASLLGWFAGAVPNYWLNRNWTWGRRGKSHLTRELLPYIAIVLATLGLATLTTTVVGHFLKQAGVEAHERVIVVAATYFAVYALVFVLRFFMLNRLFRPAESADSDPSRDAVVGSGPA